MKFYPIFSWLIVHITLGADYRYNTFTTSSSSIETVNTLVKELRKEVSDVRKDINTKLESVKYDINCEIKNLRDEIFKDPTALPPTLVGTDVSVEEVPGAMKRKLKKSLKNVADQSTAMKLELRSQKAELYALRNSVFDSREDVMDRSNTILRNIRDSNKTFICYMNDLRMHLFKINTNFAMIKRDQQRIKDLIQMAGPSRDRWALETPRPTEYYPRGKYLPGCTPNPLETEETLHTFRTGPIFSNFTFPGERDKAKDGDKDWDRDKIKDWERDRDRTKDWEKEKDKTKDWERERDKTKDWERERDKTKDWERERDKTKDWERERDKTKDWERDKTKDWERDKTKDWEKERDKTKDWEKERDKTKDWERERDKTKDWEEERGRTIDWGKDRTKDWERDRDRTKDWEKDRDRAKDWEKDRDRAKDWERDRDRTKDWDRERERGRERQRGRDRGHDRDGKDSDRNLYWGRDRDRDRDRGRDYFSPGTRGRTAIASLFTQPLEHCHDPKVKYLEYPPMPRDCQDVYDLGFMEGGVYRIQPPGVQSKEVLCEHDTTGGGWTIFLVRMTAPVQVPFNRTWREYEDGFGDATREYFLGLKILNILTWHVPHEFRAEMEDWEGNIAWAEYSYFTVAGPSDKYRLRISGYSGIAGDSMRHSHLQMFSTIDKDNDQEEWGNCARARGGGGWWWGKCACTQPTGVFRTTRHHVPELGITWWHWKSMDYALKKLVLMIRPRDLK